MYSKIFTGLETIEMDENGFLKLQWSGETVPVYTIEMQKLEVLPLLVLSGKVATALTEGQLPTGKFHGTLVAHVRGRTDYVMEEALDSSSYYIFRVSSLTSPESYNKLYLIKPDLSLPDRSEFHVDEEKLTVEWSTPTGATAFEVTANQVTQVIKDTTFQWLGYDITESYEVCVRPLRGQIRSSECLPLIFPAKQSKVRILNIHSDLSPGPYTVGDNVSLSVTFSQPVIGEDGLDLMLSLKLDGAPRIAHFVSGFGSDTLEFIYTVQAGDNTESLDARALFIEGGELKDNRGLPVQPGFLGQAYDDTELSGRSLSLSAQTVLVIDTTAPTLPISPVITPHVTSSLAMAIAWGDSTDLHFKNYEAKLCPSYSCDAGCTAVSVAYSSDTTLFGADGIGYHACVRGMDMAGNASAWVSSAAPVVAETPITFAGLTGFDVLGSWSDGHAKIKLTLGGIPDGPITEYRLYYAPDGQSINISNPPLVTIPFHDSVLDANHQDTELLVSLPSAQLFDGNYAIRAHRASTGYVDSNTQVVAGLVLSGQPGYVLVPKKYSALSYDYYIMRYEASLSASGSDGSGDSVSGNETQIAQCASKFHADGAASDASCGVKTISKSAQSVFNVLPKSSITWSSAFFACRNASNSLSMVRMPTPDEFTRAAVPSSAAYSDNWDLATTNASGFCNSLSASAGYTGSRVSCKTALNIYDLAGNLREWVDRRMVPYDIDAANEKRFDYGPVIGRTLTNGLDNTFMRFHKITPPSGGLALSLGADYLIPGDGNLKAYGADAQTWNDPTASQGSLGFRCVGFRKDTLPAPAFVAVPDEPRYEAADIPVGVPSAWKIPENLYVHDKVPESVRVIVDPSSSTTTPVGSVQINWRPWFKKVCDSAGSCSTTDLNFIYHIYRFVEPNRTSLRFPTPWALGTAGSAWSGDKPLDPLAVNVSGSRLFTTANAEGRKIVSVSDCRLGQTGNCTFTDSLSAGTDFSPLKFYMYALVAEDPEGNLRVAQTQTFRGRMFAGVAATAGGSSFRIENRLRRAAVFPVTEVYQEARSVPQTMVHVPMDLSGLDHDFYIHKYEASLASGSVSLDLPDESYTQPLPSWGTDWKEFLSKCIDILGQTGVFDAANCASNGPKLAANTAILQSKIGELPLGGQQQGSVWKGCENATFTDGQSKSYRLRLAQDSEWFKAADWGDLDLDGTIDANAFTGNVTIASLEYGAVANNTSVRCHTDNDPSAFYATGAAETATCVSRYGAHDMVGNAEEWTDGSQFAGHGSDNGLSGLGFGNLFPNGFGPISSYGGRYDLLTGLIRDPAAGSLPPTTNGDKYGWNNTYWGGSIRGGAYWSNDDAGRFAFDISQSAWWDSVVRGSRCAY